MSCDTCKYTHNPIISIVIPISVYFHCSTESQCPIDPCCSRVLPVRKGLLSIKTSPVPNHIANYRNSIVSYYIGVYCQRVVRGSLPHIPNRSFPLASISFPASGESSYRIMPISESYRDNIEYTCLANSVIILTRDELT